MKIGLDFDGVLANAVEMKVQATYDLFGIYIPPAKMKKKFILGEKLLTNKQYEDMRCHMYGSPEYHSTMRPVDGMAEYINKLWIGNTFRIITSRNAEWGHLAQEWLWNQGVKDIPLYTVNRAPKTERAEGLDVFIDDDIKKLKELKDTVKHRFHFIWPHNEHEINKKVAEPVKSWEEIYGKILEIKKDKEFKDRQAGRWR
ncbi:hypothetical protein GOV11_02450 [Candidatus Woesearchaeota archaeon]|nr:hypothetical protein [Candidatus Woesearchaeota archaeon]